MERECEFAGKRGCLSELFVEFAVLKKIVDDAGEIAVVVDCCEVAILQVVDGIDALLHVLDFVPQHDETFDTPALGGEVIEPGCPVRSAVLPGFVDELGSRCLNKFFADLMCGHREAILWGDCVFGARDHLQEELIAVSDRLCGVDQPACQRDAVMRAEWITKCGP